MENNKTKRESVKRLLKNGLSTVFFLALAAFAILQWQDDTIIPVQRNSSVAGQNDQNAVVEVGAPAPEFELPGIDGEKVNLSDFRGRPVVITFMHTW